MQILISIKKVIQEFLIFNFHIYIEFLHDFYFQVIGTITSNSIKYRKTMSKYLMWQNEKFLDKTIVYHTDKSRSIQRQLYFDGITTNLYSTKYCIQFLLNQVQIADTDSNIWLESPIYVRSGFRAPLVTMVMTMIAGLHLFGKHVITNTIFFWKIKMNKLSNSTPS